MTPDEIEDVLALDMWLDVSGVRRQTGNTKTMIFDPYFVVHHLSQFMVLEPGDLIAIPKRPNEVTVVGAVLNPGSLQFATGRRASDYVRAAGGPQRFADGGRAVVVLPNGQSVPASIRIA